MASFVRKETTEYKPLAAEDEQSDLSVDPEASVPYRQRRWPSCRQWLGLAAAQLLFLSVYTTILFKVFGLSGASGRGPQRAISSPAYDIVMWESKMLQTKVKSENAYNGPPSDEVDEMWMDLIRLSNIKLPASDLHAINKTSIEDPNDPGMGWATLGYNHEIHCLNRLRQAVHPEYYFSDWTNEERLRNQLHSRHCIDYLRQAAMCHGDVSLTTYYWAENTRLPVADFNTPHACVNWDALRNFQEERLFNPMEPGLLKHPKLGVSFPDGKGDKIGVLADQLGNDINARL